MQNLFRHIDNLLLRQECVIVPGIGGFLTHESPSFYDEDEQAFYPPHRTIGFNPQLTLNDGTLVHSYMAAERCDYRKASRSMQRDIDALQHALREHGSCSIDGIGTLKLTDDGRYSFIPLESGALTPSLFALPRFEIRPLSIADTAEKVITLKVSTVRRVASAAAAAVALVVLSIPLFNGKSSQTNQSVQQAGSPLQALSEDKTTTQGETASLDIFRNVRDMFSGNASSETQSVPDNHFTIVLACDVEPENCRIYADMIRQEGAVDDEKMRVFDDHIYYGSYATHEAAAEALRLMQDNKYFKIGWIKEVNE